MVAICAPWPSGTSCQRICSGVSRTKPLASAVFWSAAAPRTVPASRHDATSGTNLILISVSPEVISAPQAQPLRVVQRLEPHGGGAHLAEDIDLEALAVAR